MPNHINNSRLNTAASKDKTLNLDNILSTQPEIGPSIPDGGYGWVVFIATLFFQALLPNLIVSFGILLAFSKLKNNTTDAENLTLWQDKFFLVPLFFMTSRILFDSLARQLIYNSTWPRLVGTSGTCLTCTGLLFVWMGITHDDNSALFIVAGILSGFGTDLQLAQCEILLAQYFRLKLPILQHISKIVAALGYITVPILLGIYILQTNLFNVILWYQAIILQGLVINIVFRKPYYLKSKHRPYQFVIANPDDEEDIFSKNSRELQIRRQTSTDTQVTQISKIEIEPKPSVSGTQQQKHWEKFEEEDEEVKYDKLNEWETFDEDEEVGEVKHQVTVNENTRNDTNNKSLAKEMEEIKELPSPLFSDLPVNNNNTYSFDDDEIRVVASDNSNVFMPYVNNEIEHKSIWMMFTPLKEPTFYKSILMITTYHYSVFVFFTLFPSYLFIEIDNVHIKQMSLLVGILSCCTLTFLAFSFCININQKWRAFCLWILCWIGCVGYFMISDYKSESALIAGAIQVILSIANLEHICKSIMGVTPKGETSREYNLLCLISGFLFLIFAITDMAYRTSFRLLAVLHFFVGSLWLANFVYKRIRTNF